MTYFAFSILYTNFKVCGFTMTAPSYFGLTIFQVLISHTWLTARITNMTTLE